MWLTRIFLQRWPLAFVIIAFTGLAGILSWPSLIVQRLPNTELPTVGMRVNYSGASTTELRDTIVRPIEDEIAGSENLQHVDATIQTSAATIASYFSLGSPADQDLTEVIQAFNAAKSQLPSDLITPVIRIFDPNAATVVSIGITSSTLNQAAMAALAYGQISPAIEQLGGVSNVLVAGNVQAAYNVTIDPNALAGYGLTLTDVVNTIGANNLRAPGGIAYQPGRETQVDVRGDIDSPQSLANLSIQNSIDPTTGGGSSPTLYGPSPYTGTLYGWTRPSQNILLGDVSRVDASSVPIRNITFINGQPGVELQVQKTTNASEINVSKAVVADIPALKRQFPEVDFHIDFVESDYSQQQVEGVERTLVEGIILTAILMVLFLQSWRNAVVVMIAIPTSICVALFAMRGLHLSLDTISLLAMTLVIGILIDDSTVVLENITRHHDAGEEPLEAALNGRSEIGLAAIVITMVDVVVFLPIAFIGGPVGVQLTEFGLVVTVSTLTSLFVSFTITPALAGVWALKSNWKPWKPVVLFDKGFEWIRHQYETRILPWGLGHRWWVLIGSMVLVVLAVLLVPLGYVGEEYIPSADQGQIFLTLTSPPGTPLSSTVTTMRKIETEIDKIPDKQSEITNCGGFNSPFGGFILEGNIGQINLFLTEKHKQSTSYWVDYLTKLGKKYAPSSITLVKPVTDPTQGGPIQPIDEIVTRTDGGDPGPYAIKVRQALEQTAGAINVNDSAEDNLPQVAVVFDRQEARALGVSIGTASTAIRAAYGGDIASDLESPNGLVEIEVIYPQSDMGNLSNILAIPIRSATGAIVHVGDVAQLQLDPTPIVITRTNRADTVHIDANVADGYELSNVLRTFNHRISDLHLPASVHLQAAPSGQVDRMNQTLVGLGSSLAVSILLVYLLMVALYNDFRDPLIILFAVPVAVVGALGALWITHESLNLFSLIGSLLLVGLVTKNGILLVDYTNTLRRRGKNKYDAVLEAGATRFRPIIMTTAAMVSGMLPLALALEPGSSVRSSLGVVVIGGLTSSLILTLVLVPIMYLWLAPEHMAEPIRIGGKGKSGSGGDSEGEGSGGEGSGGDGSGGAGSDGGGPNGQSGGGNGSAVGDGDSKVAYPRGDGDSRVAYPRGNGTPAPQTHTAP